MSYSQVMAIDSILAQLDSEIARLNQVRSLLANSGKVSAKLSERKMTKAGNHAAGTVKPRKRRVLSPEARKRIAEAQRKRWAAQKSKAK